MVLKCETCGVTEGEPFAPGDVCGCGGVLVEVPTDALYRCLMCGQLMASNTKPHTACHCGGAFAWIRDL